MGVSKSVKRWSACGLLFGGVLCAALALAKIYKAGGLLEQFPDWARLLTTVAGALFLGTVAATLTSLLRGRGPELRAVDFRVALMLSVTGSLSYSACIGAYSYSLALLWFSGCAAGWSIWLRTRARVSRQSAVFRWLDLAAFNLSLTILLLYGGLLSAAKLFPSSLLSIPGSSNRLLETSRCPPGTMRFGFPCNRLGYYDDEPRPSPEPQILVIGDSFTLGIVPHEFLFTTVAERMTGLRIDSFGVARAGPLEYRIMLQRDGPAVDPDLVVAAVFVGNDISQSYWFRARHQGHAILRGWLDRDLNPLAIIAGRLWRLGRELASGGRLATLGEARRTTDETGDADDAKSLWLDYRLEEPTYSPAGFLELERRLAEVVCRPDRAAAYASFFEDIEALEALSGDRRLAVMLIPDEFQIEDRLWSEIVPDSVGWERDLPQQKIRPFLESRGIPYLDLLPPFRAQPREPDGQRHLYHSRNTHLNARGNQVAGEQLAAFLKTTAGF